MDEISLIRTIRTFKRYTTRQKKKPKLIGRSASEWASICWKIQRRSEHLNCISQTLYTPPLGTQNIGKLRAQTIINHSIFFRFINFFLLFRRHTIFLFRFLDGKCVYECVLYQILVRFHDLLTTSDQKKKLIQILFYFPSTVRLDTFLAQHERGGKKSNLLIQSENVCSKNSGNEANRISSNLSVCI